MSTAQHPRWVVFTDLDGTLLHHDTYQYAAAKPMLARLESHGIAVHIASSKTFSEAIGYYRDWRVKRPMVADSVQTWIEGWLDS